MITLVLEASTYAGSVALLDGSELVAECAVAMRGREHEALMPAVAQVLEMSGRDMHDIERVVCGAGPGSFTSLRIAGAIAKGIALGLAVPLVSLSSLALLVASRKSHGAGSFLAVADAMRGERYTQAFVVDAAGDLAMQGGVHIMSAADAGARAESLGALILGPDEPGEAHVVPRAGASARITKMIDASSPADLASWEPGYGRQAEAQVKWEAEHGKPLPQV